MRGTKPYNIPLTKHLGFWVMSIIPTLTSPFAGVAHHFALQRDIYIYISKPKLNRWIRVSPFISRFVGLTSCSLGLKFSISFSQIIVQHPNLCWITYVFVLMIQLYPEVGWYPPGFNIAMENIPFIDRSFTISYLQDGAPKIAKLPYM